MAMNRKVTREVYAAREIETPVKSRQERISENADSLRKAQRPVTRKDRQKALDALQAEMRPFRK
jgi:hypothetical protein